MIALECRNLHKNYGRTAALRGVDLQVEQNRVYGFLGPNGAGKTTTLKIIAGLARPDAGEVLIDGQPLRPHSSLQQQRIGYLAQEPRYYPWMTGRELVEFTAQLFGYRGRELKQRTGELLELTGLGAAADRRLGGYSGGMLQRLGIAQALCHRPRILILDEPASALDPVGRREVLELIAQLGQDTTVFFSTHILDDVERICQDIAILKDGQVILAGERQRVLADHAPAQVAIALSGQRLPELQLPNLQQPIANSASAPQPAQSAQQPGRLILPLEQWHQEQASILARISQLELRIESIEPLKASLEDLFLQLIGEPSNQEDHHV